MNVFSAAKAGWHIDRISALRERRDIVPTHIQLVIADLCNQACGFCSYRRPDGFAAENFADEKGNRNPVRFIPTAKAKEILDDCAELGVEAIEFTGGGEPTVHKDHIQIIGHAQSLGLQTALVTNAVLMKDDPVYHKLDWLRVSLDAGSEGTYERIRVSKAWPKVMKNLKLASSFDKPFVGVGFVITSDNYREIYRAALIARDSGSSYLRLSAMFSGEGSGHYDGIRDEINAGRADAKKLETDKFKIHDLFGDRISDLDQGRPDYSFCGQQQFVLYIGGDQKVYTCCTNAYTTHGEIGDLKATRFKKWMKSHRRYDFDARSCHHCQFHPTNRAVEYLLNPAPPHVAFV